MRVVCYCGRDEQRDSIVGRFARSSSWLQEKRPRLSPQPMTVDRQTIATELRTGSLSLQTEEVIQDPCVTGVPWCFFFFSSRRRHTRSLCDWSSDVCSSD